MASAKGRVLTSVRGSIENAAKHWGRVSNGKQHIVCRRTDRKHELTDTQKIQCVKFANNTRIANAIAKMGKLYEIDAADRTEQQTEFYGAWQLILFSNGAWNDADGNPKAILIKELVEAFRNQPRDEQGSVEHPTFAGYIFNKVIPCLTDDGKNLIKTTPRASVTIYDESVEGYNTMKSTTAAAAWLVEPEP